MGCTKFCVHPVGLRKEVAVVGGTKDVKVEVVLDARPTLVVASKEENVREQVEAIGDEVEVWLTDVQTVEQASALVAQLGERFDASLPASRINAANALALKRLARPARGSALYFIWRDPWMSVGGDTYIHGVMTALGYDNLLGDRLRYPSLTPEEVGRLSPKHVLLSSEPFPFRERHLAEFRAWCPGAAVTLVDGELFSWYGSRLGKLA